MTPSPILTKSCSKNKTDSHTPLARREDQPLPRALHLDDAPKTVSMTGLIVNPTVAQTQIDAERPTTPSSTQARSTYPEDRNPGHQPPGTQTPPVTTPQQPTPATAIPRHQTNRPRTSSTRHVQIADEILNLLTTNGIDVTVTVDIESQNLADLPAEQVDALRENLNTLGFTDWNIE